MAKDAQEKLTNQYMNLIDWYYADRMPLLDKQGVPYYIRTYGLYNSFKPYWKNSHNSIYYGGVKITSAGMKDYDNVRGNGKFSADALLNTFIYNPQGTWHGGDWHGGYGERAGFSIYNEMRNYKKKLINEYRAKYESKR